MKLAIIVPAAIAILAATGAHAQTGSADDGHRLVQRDCAMCHDVERTGASANPAAPPFRNLHLIYPLNQIAQALAEGTIANHPPMSPYHLSASEIADIVRYLNSIQTDQQSQNAPAARWTVKALDP
jgi:mono/diheme cytochrome c family protein